jgi:hypothetical protein
MTEQAMADKDSTELLTDELQAIKDRAHKARVEYERQRGLYHDFVNDIVSLIKACLTDQNISYHTITGRAKDLDSFERKRLRLRITTLLQRSMMTLYGK